MLCFVRGGSLNDIRRRYTSTRSTAAGAVSSRYSANGLPAVHTSVPSSVLFKGGVRFLDDSILDQHLLLDCNSTGPLSC